MVCDVNSVAPSVNEQDKTVLSIRGLDKRFGGTEALDDVDFSVERGEIHALLGANGAGKSTLIKILAGIYSADAGSILINGKQLDQCPPGLVSFVHQDLGLIETMSVGENMAMGYGYPMRAGGRLIDWRAVDDAAAKALDFIDSPLPLDRPISELSRAEKSIVAIARALVGKAELLVLDEPTASLPEADVGRLFAVLNKLRENNVSVIYVTHRLDEVFKIADALTVLRDGKTVSMYRPLNLSPEQLVSDIVGHIPDKQRAARVVSEGASVLEVRDLSVEHVGPISFHVQPGEIVGLAGLRGAGHEEIGRAIGGVLPATGGEVVIGGEAVRLKNPGDAIAAGLGFATGKRAEEAIAEDMDLKENLFLNPLNFGYSSWGLRSRTKEAEAAAEIFTRFDVKPPDPARDIATLSGGNQQKVVLARWAGQRYKILVLEDPTIGVDFGAKAEIYRMMAEDAAAGTAALVVSSDLEELVEICDRVLAFSGGRVFSELSRADLTIETLTGAVGGLASTTGNFELRENI